MRTVDHVDDRVVSKESLKWKMHIAMANSACGPFEYPDALRLLQLASGNISQAFPNSFPVPTHIHVCPNKWQSANISHTSSVLCSPTGLKIC